MLAQCIRMPKMIPRRVECTPMKSKVIVIALALLTVAAAGGLILAAFMTGSESRTVSQRSADLPDDAAKLAFLKKYLKMESDIDAVEFFIVYHDNSRMVPGPSDWDMRIAMRMPPDRVNAWSTGLLVADEKSDLAWGYDLLPKSERWAIHSKPKIYTRGRTVVAIFEPEGIVFKRAATY